MKFSRKFMIFLVLFILSLFIVLFVTKTKDYNTGKDSIGLSFNGYKSFKKGIDLVGGVVLTYRIDFSDYEKTYSNSTELAQAKRAVKNVIEKEIDKRVNSLGVSDYSSSFKLMNGIDYLEVQLGGVSDIEYAKTQIGKTVKLDFKLPYDTTGTGSAAEEQSRLAASEDALKSIVLSGVNMGLYQNPSDNIYYINESYSSATLTGVIKSNFDKIVSVGSGNFYPSLLTGSLAGLDGWAIVKYNGESTGGSSTGANYSFEYLFIGKTPAWKIALDPKTNKILNGSYFLQALVEQGQTGQPSVRIDFNTEGKDVWCNITTANVGKALAIFVGGELVSNPVIQEPICGGSTQISFGQTNYEDARKEARSLVDQLNYTMPVPLVLANEEKVSPLLGDAALKGAIIAGVVGFVVIFFFMTYMYGLRLGILSTVGLLVFLTVLFAIIKIIGIPLSLSGIAAIILNIGMAVDANILLYERLREELLKGKNIHTSIVDAYDRSYLAIRDGNLTTGFIGLLLFMIGINIFKGFGTMMILNIILTMFIVVPLAKELLLHFKTNK